MVWKSIQNVKIGTRLGLSYGLITTILIGTSIYSIYSMNRLSELTAKLYRHPFTVSTSMLRVEAGILKMHRSIRDVLLSSDAVSLEGHITKIEQYEQQVYADFDVAQERFLGDKEDIAQARQVFADWKPIRDRIIASMRMGKREQALAILRSEGVEHTSHLFDDIQKINDFASNKASEFVKNAELSRRQTIQTTIVVIITFVFLVIGLAIIITRSITESLYQAVKINHKLAEGNLSIEVQSATKDEIGQLLSSIQQMIRILKETVGNVKKTSESVALGSQHMSSSALQMASGATEQAAATEEASVSISNMITNIRANSENAAKTQSISLQASENAQTTRQAMLEAVGIMKTIIEKISIVEEIAMQTNLLALNASIEASRSQDRKSGFSVVAGEIRKLAQRTRIAAADINQLASSSVASASKAEMLLNQLVPVIQTTATAVAQISNISDQQLQGSLQINQAIRQLDQVTQQNSDAAGSISQMAQELAVQAKELQGAIEFFQVS